MPLYSPQPIFADPVSLRILNPSHRSSGHRTCCCPDSRYPPPPTGSDRPSDSYQTRSAVNVVGSCAKISMTLLMAFASPSISARRYVWSRLGGRRCCGRSPSQRRRHRRRGRCDSPCRWWRQSSCGPSHALGRGDRKRFRLTASPLRMKTGQS